MSDLVDEVDAELRAERAKRLARRYGALALGAILLVLAGVAGWQGWRWYEAREAGRAAETYLAAMREAAAEGVDLAAAAERFAAVAETAPAGYRVLARLRAAALYAEIGQRGRALQLYDAVAGDAGADPLYRDLALVLWGLHALDEEDPARVAQRLAPLAAAGTPWRASAREVLLIAAIRRGDAAEARRQLDALLADEHTPAGVRERATRAVEGLGI